MDINPVFTESAISANWSIMHNACLCVCHCVRFFLIEYFDSVAFIGTSTV